MENAVFSRNKAVVSEISSLCVEEGQLWLCQVFARLKMSVTSLASQALSPTALAVALTLGETWRLMECPKAGVGSTERPRCFA